jgi:malonyl-ACP decarboxylase
MSNIDELCITGIGVMSAIGQDKETFLDGLLTGRHAFGVMKRKGRQHASSAFLGAEIPLFDYPNRLTKHKLRSVSFPGQVAVATIEEAWNEALLDQFTSDQIGLVIGGSNVGQREQCLMQQEYREKPHFIRPHYGLSFLDSDLCGICTESFGIQGMAYTVGGASASGHLAILQAINAVLSGQVDVCIALGAMMDLSYFELQAFSSLGAMGSVRFSDQPERACRPFDCDRDGFIFGESCGAVVIERVTAASERGVPSYGTIAGWAMNMDAHRNPNPGYEGEVAVIQRTLSKANIEASAIDYVNPHGSGSKLGDEIELKAIQTCGLSHARVNATKSIIGHGLSSAGTVEIIATLLQMKASCLHPSRNLDNPINPELNWVGDKAVSHHMEYGLNLSIGFGGINTAICLKNSKREAH